MPGAHAEAALGAGSSAGQGLPADPAGVPDLLGQPIGAVVLPDDAADRDGVLRGVPSYAHQKACLRLRDVLALQIADRAVVTLGVGWLLPQASGRAVRVPDVLVLLEEPVADVVTSVPLVVVEVLGEHRADDLVLKSPEYLAAGVEQYWVLDPRDRVLDVFGRGLGGWERIGRLSEWGELVVDVPEVGPVTLDGPTIMS